MFSNLRLRQRILLGYLFPLLLLILAMTLVFVNMREASRLSALQDFTENIIHETKDLALGLTLMQRSTRGYLLRKDPLEIEGFQKGEKWLEEHSESLANTMKDPQQLESLHRLVEMAQALKQTQHKMIALVDEGKAPEAIDLYQSANATQRANEVEKVAEEIVQREMDLFKERHDNYDNAMRTVVNSILFGMLAAILLSLAIALWLAATISRKITFNATQLSSAGSEIAATIAQHERTASQQAASVNETSATIEELSASSRQAAEQAANSAALAERSSQATVQGGDITRQTVAAMGSLNDKIGVMADQILHLGEQSGQIGNIATLLKDLAGQINMLSLNAAVEAARAGEHGKGFAVVASEIRKLADQSRKSAEQTAVLVADIQKSTNSSIMVTEEGTRTVAEATQLVQNVADLFNNLAGLARGVNENSQQLMLNTKQQSAAFAQVVLATNNIAAGAKETVAGIGQTKAGVQVLNNAVENLKAIV
jgi:methyl-accepting chemotaxis protein